MANRFTATEKWIDPWFCELNEKDKLFWIYLVDNCDHAGMWQVNWPLVKFHIKDYIFNEDVFKNRVIKIKNNKWFIPKFIEFQYKTGLNPDNRAHLSVINILKKEGAYKGLARGLQARKDMDMVIDKDKDKGVVKGVINLSTDDHKNLVETYGSGPAKDYIDRLNDYAAQFPAKFAKYASHYATIRNWMRRDGVKKLPPKPQAPKEELRHDPKVAELIRETKDRIGTGKA